MPDNTDSLFYRPDKETMRKLLQDYEVSFPKGKPFEHTDGEASPELRNAARQYMKENPKGLMDMMGEMYGRKGDSKLIFANPEEEALLKARGGAGEPHPMFSNVKQYYDNSGEVSAMGGIDTNAGDAGAVAESGPGPDGSGGGGGGGDVASGEVESMGGIDTNAGNAASVVEEGPGPQSQADPSEGPNAAAGAPPGPLSKPAPTMPPELSKIDKALAALGVKTKAARTTASVIGGILNEVLDANPQDAVNAQNVVGIGGPSAQGPGNANPGVGGGISTTENSPESNGGPGSGAYEDTLVSANSQPRPRPARSASSRNSILNYALSLSPLIGFGGGIMGMM